MDPLPIVRRELLAAARTGKIYRARYWAGGIATLASIAVIVWGGSTMFSSVKPGSFLFLLMGLAALVYCIGGGIFLTLDAISSERRQGTLGLLFLTELHGYDIVLGKLASACASGFGSFLAFFPFLALALCLGGVTGVQYWSLSIALSGVLFFSLSFGLLLSCVVRRDGLRMPLFLGLILLPSGWILFELYTGRPASNWAALLNPLYPVYQSFGFRVVPFSPPTLVPLMGMPSGLFAKSLLACFVLSLLMLAIASFITPRLIREPVVKPSPWRKLSGIFLGNLPLIRRRNDPLRNHPVLWLNVRDKQPILTIWTIFMAGLATLLWDPLSRMGQDFQGLFYAFLLHYSLKWMAAFQACKFIAQERETGFLEAILTTPVNNGVVLHGKIRALKRYFLFPLTYALLIHAWVAIKAAMFGFDSPALWLAIGSAILLLVDFHGFAWIALLQGLKVRGSHRAFVRAFLVGGVQPWLPFIVITAFLFIVFARGFQADPTLLLVIGSVSAAVFGAGIGLWSMARLHFILRQRIAEAD